MAAPPTVTELTARVYNALPEAYRVTDGQQTIPKAVAEVREIINVLRNPSAEVDLTYWNTGATTTLARASVATAPAGTYYVEVTIPTLLAAGSSYYVYGAGVGPGGFTHPTAAGEYLTARAVVTAIKACQVSLAIAVYDSAGGGLGSSAGNTVTLAVGDTVTLEVRDYVAPTGAGGYIPILYIWEPNGTSPASTGLWVRTDAWAAYNLTTPGGWAAGAAPYGDGTVPGWAWTGTAHASSSRRLPVTAVAAGYPLLRYLALILDEAGKVDAYLNRFDYVPTDDPDYQLGDYQTSDLVDPLLADAAWLPWLAQLLGIRLNTTLAVADQRTAIANPSAGWQAGSQPGIASAAATALTGTRSVSVRATGPFQVTVITQASETASPAAVLAAIDTARARPAGVSVVHSYLSASWATIATVYPTWAGWSSAGSWRTIMAAT